MIMSSASTTSTSDLQGDTVLEWCYSSVVPAGWLFISILSAIAMSIDEHLLFELAIAYLLVHVESLANTVASH